MCGQVQGLAVFPKGCSEGPWLQEVTLETCQWEEPGRSHQELEETWEGRAGGPSIPVDKVRATASHMVSCVSNFGADDVDTEAMSPPPGLHPGPRKPAAVRRTQKPLHHSHWPASRCLKASSSRNPHEQRAEPGVLQGMNPPGSPRPAHHLLRPGRSGSGSVLIILQIKARAGGGAGVG